MKKIITIIAPLIMLTLLSTAQNGYPKCSIDEHGDSIASYLINPQVYNINAEHDAAVAYREENAYLVDINNSISEQNYNMAIVINGKDSINMRQANIILAQEAIIDLKMDDNKALSRKLKRASTINYLLLIVVSGLAGAAFF